MGSLFVRSGSELLTIPAKSIVVKPAVYVLACRDGSLYTGATTDLQRRFEAHRRRIGAKYTRGRLPVALVAWWHPQTFAAAKSHEARFKRLSRKAKLAILRGGEAYGCPLHRTRAKAPPEPIRRSARQPRTSPA